jgi:hypothetical protein
MLINGDTATPGFVSLDGLFKRLMEPDEYDPAVRHRLAAIPEHGGRVLRVICDETPSPWTIITAYFDRSLRGAL